MANFEKRFFKDIYKNSGGFLPTWPLGRQVKLGDVVDIKHRRMDYLGNLSDPLLDIKITPGPDESQDETKWQSSKSVTITLKAAGETNPEVSNLPIDKAGIKVEFSKSGGFLFQPKGMNINRIENLVSVRSEAIKKLSAELFSMRSIFMIVEVGIVESYALTISESDSSLLELSVEGEQSISTKDLARTDLNFQYKTESQLDFNNIGAEGGSIFFKCEKMRVRRDKVVELRQELPSFLEAPDDVQAMLIPNSRITPENALEYFEFTPLTLDDLEVFLGTLDE
ncbi:hypothetical protein [Lewinella sp. IMCC34191]|uniref:hypothetical protein n=1 Tax=Lewinella sp. IMCC34191 TaxID=2259172 RepID=UPI0013005890|nr:hypothetical protein [Lewinella sp. IMCC34191]